MTIYKFGHNSLRRLGTVDTRLQNIAERAIQITNVDFGIPASGGKRAIEDQYQLYLDRKTECDGTRKRSKHQDGLALDVYAYVNGKANWEEKNLALIAAAMLQAASELNYRIQWGGHWTNFKDMPHFELME